MSEGKLKKYLKRPLPPIIGNKILTPVILTDSKGFGLWDQVSTQVELEIRWWCKSSRTSQKGFTWLQQNIAQNIERIGNIHLYVWLGTCDLTTYDSKFISITSEQNIIQQITDIYQQIVEFLKSYPGCKITFLEIPPYSIIDFNSYKKHDNPSSFKNQDEQLLKNVQELNNNIRYINSTLDTSSPNFAKDINHHHQEKTSKSKKLTLRDNYMFKLYRDGIHPKPTLSKVWLKKLATQIQRQCWG
ncbi:unnamed protein product [Mytilus coruscus]|uniref:Uncharacterized protein n=1 Tax=Mytilus coruscus TaxID=42192 RepID=A0A6J8B421_MYTCO|nr:unnamed protein product [Mytilus coruscus]